MTHYSIDHRNRTFLKCYEILYFAKNMSKNIGKDIVRTYDVVNIVKNFLIMLNSLVHMHLKLIQKQ